jgi:O-antigen/teichoic acid export membrane protein
MFGKRPLQSSGSDRSQGRTLLGTTMIVAVVVVAVIVAILIVAKGVWSALPAIFGGICFSATLVLYWLRSKKGDSSAGDYDE